ncbi:MAG: DUF177 domain-containing protein [Vicinamibacteria bacterium]
MLLIEIARIPPKGLDLDEALSPEAVHLQGDDELTLEEGRLRCHLEIVDGTTVHVNGQLAGRVAVECGRCLDPYPVPIEHTLDLFYLPRVPDRPEDEEDIQLSDHQVVVGYYDKERLDLGEVVREQLFLALPLKRVCRPDCGGLCPSCGRNRNKDRCACPAPEEPLDARLEPLRKLVDPDRH